MNTDALTGPTVGRDVELAELDALLGALRQGASACVAVEGEPGIGKTRHSEAICSSPARPAPHGRHRGPSVRVNLLTPAACKAEGREVASIPFLHPSRGGEMPRDAPPDPPATTLARGPAKTDDIERSRRDLQRAEKGVCDVLRAAADRHDHEPDDRRSTGRGGARDGS